MSPLRLRRHLKILITAGPTREKIDPVRFISNYSTGRMGYAIAREARKRAHSVVLVSGPSSLEKPERVARVFVERALDMKREVLKKFKSCDALIMASAVCDWRPTKRAGHKIKKSGKRMTLELVENPDILLEAGRKKRGLLVGFALETEELAKNAVRKLKEKNLDFIVANRLSKTKNVFGERKADFLIIDKFGGISRYTNHSKDELASRIIDKVEALCYSATIGPPVRKNLLRRQDRA